MERSLEDKLGALHGALTSMEQMILCFSGGVDSSFLLRAAFDAVGPGVLAFTTVSPTNPEEDTEDAVALARELGVTHVVLHANELEIPNYRENPLNRCYFCKSNLYELAAAEAARRGIRWIVDGVNLDDLGDYRPGLQAAGERSIAHPLADAGLTKADVRAASRALGLRSWDRPASPCLSSRFPYGTEITPEGLDRVARGERWLRAQGVRECRVRYYGERARVELPLEAIPRFEAGPLRDALVTAFREFGFREVEIDPRGFRSGRLNEGVTVPPAAS